MKMRRGSLKWVSFISIGIVLLVIVGYLIWDSNEKTKEIQQIESKLGFEIKVVDRQSHGTFQAPTRTYTVKPINASKENETEYILYLNEKDEIEQWAMIKNGKIVRPDNEEDE